MTFILKRKTGFNLLLLAMLMVGTLQANKLFANFSTLEDIFITDWGDVYLLTTVGDRMMFDEGKTTPVADQVLQISKIDQFGRHTPIFIEKDYFPDDDGRIESPKIWVHRNGSLSVVGFYFRGKKSPERKIFVDRFSKDGKPINNGDPVVVDKPNDGKFGHFLVGESADGRLRFSATIDSKKLFGADAQEVFELPQGATEVTKLGRIENPEIIENGFDVSKYVSYFDSPRFLVMRDSNPESFKFDIMEMTSASSMKAVTNPITLDATREGRYVVSENGRFIYELDRGSSGNIIVARYSFATGQRDDSFVPLEVDILTIPYFFGARSTRDGGIIIAGRDTKDGEVARIVKLDQFGALVSSTLIPEVFVAADVNGCNIVGKTALGRDFVDLQPDGG